MKAPKLRKKLLAGILCASMLLQTVPMNVNADEGDKTVQATESIEVQTDEEAEEKETKSERENIPEETEKSTNSDTQFPIESETEEDET